MYIDYYTLLSNRTSNKFKKYLHYKEKTSEKLLQQVAIKKLKWHHNYGTILTNIIIIIVMSWHIYLFWGFCIIILTELI